MQKETETFSSKDCTNANRFEKGGTSNADNNMVNNLSKEVNNFDEVITTSHNKESSSNNPGHAAGLLVRTAKMAAALVAPNGQFEYIVPCNTFHAPDIFNACVDSSGGIQPIHMIMETVKHIYLTYPNAKKVGVMCTTGTRSLRLYHDMLEDHGYTICEVSDDEQIELHRTIYDKNKGIKSKGKTTWSTNRFQLYAKKCVDLGAEVIILGCTEIPIVLETFEKVPLVDPLVCGARAIIQKTYPNKLKNNGI